MKQVYLDMDGTISQFVRQLLLVHDLDHDEVMADWPKGWYDLDAVLGMSGDDIWKPVNGCGGAFWATMRATDWCSDLRSLLIESNAELIICTKVMSDKSYSGKRLWLFKHRFDTSKMIAMPHGVCKSVMAAPGRLLVDDSDENCDAWRAAGGEAITVPQPWNHCTDTIEQFLRKVRIALY